LYFAVLVPSFRTYPPRRRHGYNSGMIKDRQPQRYMIIESFKNGDAAAAEQI
jgi:hypothetical protein